MQTYRLTIAMAILLAFCGSAPRAEAATWTLGSGTGYWTNSANWSPAVVPGPTDDAVINSGNSTIVIDGDVLINSLNITNTFTGSLNFVAGTPAGITMANDLYLKSGATINCQYSSTNGNGTGRVISVGGSATVNGTISASALGFPASQGPGYSTRAAHGGWGTDGTKAPYGSVTQPTSLGSGGWGAAGGGAVKLAVTNTLTLNGSVTANGGYGGSGGPGSGGSIWLICNALAGNGTIAANAAGSPDTAHSGGGRVAIYRNSSTFSGSVSVAGGGTFRGQPGTLYEPGRFPTGAPGNYTNVTLGAYQYWFADTTTNYWNLTVTNVWAEVHGGSLSVSNLTVSSGWLLAGGYWRQSGTFAIDGTGTAMSNFTVVGSALLTNSSTVYWPPTSSAMAGDLTVATGSTVCALCDTNAINADAGGTSGARYGVGPTIRCRNALINGAISADGLGFPANKGPGAAARPSHGGKGYDSDVCYGSFDRPTELGSGGWEAGGGGAVTLVASDTLTVNGSVTANGGTGSSGGPGTGGSLWMVCNALAGNGTIAANGGGAGANAGAGGGRIALDYASSSFSGGVTVNPSSSGANVGKTGTVFRCQSPSFGLSLPGLSAVALATNTFDVNKNGAMIVRTVSQWSPSVLEWRDASSNVWGGTLANTGTYTLTGLPPSQKVTISTNSTLMLSTNSTAAGTLVIGPLALNGPLTVRVDFAPVGSLLMIQ